MKKLTDGLKALTTIDEQREVNMIGSKPLDLKTMKKGERVTLANGVTLERSFDQSDFQGGFVAYARVVGPEGHRSFHSDLSMDGLKEWGIL